MIDIKEISGGKLTAEGFKDFVLELERENLRNIDKEDKKQMVSKIVNCLIEMIVRKNIIT